MDCLDLLFFVAVALLVLTKGGKIPEKGSEISGCHDRGNGKDSVEE